MSLPDIYYFKYSEQKPVERGYSLWHLIVFAEGIEMQGYGAKLLVKKVLLRYKDYNKMNGR